MKALFLAGAAALALSACVDANGNMTAIGAQVASVQAQLAVVTGIQPDEQTCVLQTDLAYRKSNDPDFAAMSTKQRGLKLAADCGIETSQWSMVISLLPGD